MIVCIKIEQDLRNGEKLQILGRDYEFTDQFYTNVDELSQLPAWARVSEDPFVRHFRKVMGLKSPRN